jgi:hypothetical protein
MALAYATDLATGHSRDFALRSCVLGMRFADVAGLGQDTHRRIYHKNLPACALPVNGTEKAALLVSAARCIASNA